MKNNFTIRYRSLKIEKNNNNKITNKISSNNLLRKEDVKKKPLSIKTGAFKNSFLS